MEPRNYETIIKLKDTYKKFRTACDQVILLNNNIESAQIRFERAVRSGHQPMRYTLRMQVHTLEKVRDMIYEYSHGLAKEMNKLQQIIIEENCVDLLTVLIQMGVEVPQ